ncbi:AAA family ATPase [Piscibacillus salipiscarius]|uniref:AAA family ATPase n=1 Tax=Piscibacillus salipiscarius TaxID=299480 RepID=UPI0034E29CC9
MPISDELSYFYGPNEAGKSSIRMFIIYILFGLKSDEREQYLSKVDGQLGGRLLIEVNYVTYTLERFLHKNRGHLVVSKNGIKLSEHEVNKVLKGINRPLFESIFSFEDRDLQSIRQHKKKILERFSLT